MQQPDMKQLRALMQSPAGQQLLQFLKEHGGSAPQEAAARAEKGDLTGARESLVPLLEDPRLRELLQQLGGTL